MSHETLKLRFKKLSLNKKFILVGAFLAIICAFLPWYSDIDKFKTGITFYGISGPLYLAGLFVFFAGIANLGIVLLKLLEKPVPKLPLKEDHFFVFTSVLSFLMLIISSSVYFHPKFGINPIDKTMGIGMILGFIGNGLVLLGALLALRKKELNFDSEGELKPLIDLEKDRVQSPLISNDRPEKPFEKIPGTLEKGTFGRDMAQESMNRLSQEKHNTNDIF